MAKEDSTQYGSDPTTKGKKGRNKYTAGYWRDEINKSQKMLRDFQRRGNKAVNIFVDDHPHRNDLSVSYADASSVNLFHANVVTLKSMLYGNTPKVDVSRRFSDADDDISRVTALMAERMLNNDIQENGEDYDTVLRACLEDRLIPGLGAARVRYEMLEGEDEKLLHEDVVCEYVHWRDICWGWVRNWKEMPWLAYRAWMTKDEVSKRFGEKAINKCQFKRQNTYGDDKNIEDGDQRDTVEKAEVWEVWCKESNMVYWLDYNSSLHGLLDKKTDPLGLDDFFPSPPFLAANVTTTVYIPTCDYYLTQELYEEVDRLQTRIMIITEAVKVVGVYDKASTGISRMLTEGLENDLIPV